LGKHIRFHQAHIQNDLLTPHASTAPLSNRVDREPSKEEERRESVGDECLFHTDRDTPGSTHRRPPPTLPAHLCDHNPLSTNAGRLARRYRRAQTRYVQYESTPPSKSRSWAKTTLVPRLFTLPFLLPSPPPPSDHFALTHPARHLCRERTSPHKVASRITTHARCNEKRRRRRRSRTGGGNIHAAVLQATPFPAPTQTAPSCKAFSLTQQWRTEKRRENWVPLSNLLPIGPEIAIQPSFTLSPVLPGVTGRRCGSCSNR
jgi:hypothetical protein